MFENSDCVDMNFLPKRLNNRLDNSMFHYLGITTKMSTVAGSPEDLMVNPMSPTVFDSVPDNVYLAGEYCSTPNLQLPTMEKACEAGKIAAQRIIADYGLTSQKRIDSIKSGKKTEVGSQIVTDRYVSVSALVQVTGLYKTTELNNFTNISLFEGLRIALYTGFRINYPSYIKPIVIIILIILITVIIFLIYKSIRSQL